MFDPFKRFLQNLTSIHPIGDIGLTIAVTALKLSICPLAVKSLEHLFMSYLYFSPG